MGEVYLAQQKQPVRRQVAIKMIQRDLNSSDILKRFCREQQTLANMDHPNIARIIDAGVSELGIHYIAMEFVDGKPLLDYCKSNHLDIRDRVKLLMQCCRAIQHAHQKGSIHRDIKPNNILVMTFDSEPLVKVIDFGIAKALGSGPTLVESYSDQDDSYCKNLNKDTSTGASPGTPRYMSPEQYHSNSDMVDTRSDIYSLGAVLYHLLAKVPPFDDLPMEKMTLDEICKVISQRDAIPPSKRNPEEAKTLRGDLDAIVHKAMHRNPEDRYQTVSGLLDDLNFYLSDLPILARTESRWTRLRRFGKRNKMPIAAVMLSVLALTLGLLLSVRKERRAIAAERRATRQAYGSDLLLTSMAITKRNLSLADDLLERQAHRLSVIDAESFHAQRPPIAWRFLKSQLPEEPSTIIQLGTKIYFGMELADRQEVAIGCKDSHLRLVGKGSGKVRIDIDTQQKEINGLALASNKQIIATAGDDGTVKLWDAGTGRQVGGFHASNDPVFQIGWTADGSKIVTAGDAPDVKIWNADSYQLEFSISSSEEALECLAVGNCGAIAYGSDRGVVRIAKINSSGATKIQNVSVFMSRSLNVNRCSTVAFSPTSRMLAVGLDNGYLVLLLEKLGVYYVVESIRFPTTVTALHFANDESRLFIGENNGSVHLLDLPDQWPTRSRLRFTRFFFDECSRSMAAGQLQDPDDLWGFVSQAKPGNARTEVPLDCDRIYLEFTKPLKNILFSENYVREWLDDAGDPRSSWSEMPQNVIFKDNGIELQFENRFGGYFDIDDLETQGRLTTWSCNSRRVSSIDWNEVDGQILSFSEDGSVKVVHADASSREKFGGKDILEFATSVDGDVYVSRAGSQSEVGVLGRDFGGYGENDAIADESMHCLGLVPNGKGRFLFAERRKSVTENEGRTRFFWCDLRRRQRDEVLEMPDSFYPLGVVGQIADQVYAVIARSNVIESRFDLLGRKEDGGSGLYLASWDVKHNEILWSTPETENEFRLPKTSRDGRYLSYVRERQVVLVDCKTGLQSELWDFAGTQIESTCFSWDGAFLLVAFADNLILCFDTETGDKKWVMQTPGSKIGDLAWSRDLKTIICVSQDNYIRMFDAELLQMIVESPLPEKMPTSVKISDEEDWIYVLGRDGALVRIPCGKVFDHL
jgi:serine/threonine protein kinase/WD40 repeat protein